MRISRMMSAAVVAALVAAATAPAPANAQIGRLIKKALKEKAVQAVVDKATSVAGAQPDNNATAQVAETSPAVVPTAKKSGGAASHPGPSFSENLLEITPELLDRFEKGLAAEAAARREIDRLIGMQLAPEAFRECSKAVMSSPEVQKIYREAGDLMDDDTSYAHILKVSQEMARRFDRLVEPKCGLDTQKAQAVRAAHADRLAAAAPQASGLMTLQLSLLKERIIPLCAAIETLAEVAGEARIPTESAAIYWVYTRGEVAALQPRCAKLSAALKTAL